MQLQLPAIRLDTGAECGRIACCLHGVSVAVPVRWAAHLGPSLSHSDHGSTSMSLLITPVPRATDRSGISPRPVRRNWCSAWPHHCNSSQGRSQLALGVAASL